MARAAMRGKITALQEAFTGYFTDHHAFLLQQMLARVDAIDAGIAALDDKIGQMIAPFAAAQRLDEIPGINSIAACVILAGIGIDRFPTAGHLVSWAKFATTSASSKPSATRSPSNPRPDTAHHSHPAPPTLRRALPRAR